MKHFAALYRELEDVLARLFELARVSQLLRLLRRVHTCRAFVRACGPLRNVLQHQSDEIIFAVDPESTIESSFESNRRGRFSTQPTSAH